MSTDITNWRDAGHNIWGFQNADKILKTSMVQYRPEPTKFKSTTLDLHGFKLRGQDETPLNLPTFLSQTETDGLVVLKNGIIAFEYYGRTNTRQSVHAIFSISKSITSLICGVLEEQGKLKPEDLVSSHIPEVQGSAYENVTIRQLLDMRSGIEHDDAAPGYRNATGLYPINPDAPPTDLHSYLPSIKSSSPRPVVGLDGPPYEYSSPNIDLLGWAIERASGKKLPDVLTEVLWQPMGAENIAHFITDRSGNARAAGGICATTRDIARVGQVVLQPDQGIVPRSWVQDILQNGSRSAFDAGSERSEYEKIFTGVAYRSCWIVDQDNQVMMASGTNGQLLLIDHRNGVVMAKTSSQPEKTAWEKIRLTVNAFREFTRIINEQCH